MNLRRMDLDCLRAPQRELEVKSFSKAPWKWDRLGFEPGPVLPQRLRRLRVFPFMTAGWHSAWASGSVRQVVKAFVVLIPQFLSHDRDQLTKELQQHVKSVTAPYKYPRKVNEGRAGALPGPCAPSLLGWAGRGFRGRQDEHFSPQKKRFG